MPPAAITHTRVERMPITIYGDPREASRYVAGEIAALIRARAEAGEQAVLGLATGSTPTRVYDELIRLHREEGLSFANVVTFNLDEYYPIEPMALQSYVRYMDENLFDHVDVPPEQVHIPDGTLDRDAVPAYCQAYEEAIREAGGLDVQLLGIGRTGHIGFNEPGSGRGTRTRLITLDHLTRQDAAGDFFGQENVPRRAITMGVGTILEADRVFLLAWGEHKAPVVREAVEGPISDQVPATFLQEHDHVEVILDEAAASELTRRKTPWLVSYCDWDDDLIHQAVVWLSQEVEKPVLKLTDADYNEHGMSDVVTDHGPAYNINIQIFNRLQHTITGWPGGKPEADDTSRPERAVPFPKRCLVFSPHPGDAMISMGGTVLRLVEHGHEVHLAYQTSGSLAVYDDEALRFADFVTDVHDAFGFSQSEDEDLFARVSRYLRGTSAEDVDPPELRTVKELIRRGEAKAAARYCGVPAEHLHFLQMPFYETGRIRKNPLGEDDVRRVMEVIERVRPHQIYAAGELADPHGTHRLCLDAVQAALRRFREEGADWLDDCYIWLYRGAWQSWEIHEIEMAVPLSPGEIARKRAAVYKHETQKDRPLYPGSDAREFWDRVDARTRMAARSYDALGLAEYEAMESFVRWVG